MKTLRRIGYRLSKTPIRVPLVWMRHQGLRRSDVFLASYPRSGNTWLRFLLAEILTGGKVDFDNINRFVPELSLHRGATPLLAQSGLLIKTHELYRAEYCKAIYVVRDVRDVALSNYARGVELGLLSNTSFEDFLLSFLKGDASRVGTWQEHVRSWLESPLEQSGTLHVVRFEDLRRDTDKSIQKLLAFIGVTPDPEKVRQAILNNSIRGMRSKEDASKTLPSSTTDSGRFVRSGSVAGWREKFNPRQLSMVAHFAGNAMLRLGYPPGLEA